MKPRTLISLFMISILVLACNMSSVGTSGTAPQAPVSKPVTKATATTAPAKLPTDTPKPVPSNTATITKTITPSAPMVTPKSDAVNCHFGPGVDYLTTGGLKVGTTTPILGQNGDGTWWQITNPNNIDTKCWLSASVTNTTGNTGGLPVVPAPLPFATAVTANNPANINTPGCMGPIQPQTLTGTIVTNGPVSVTWHFESQQGGTFGNHTTTFTKYGSQTVTDSSYTPPLTPGTYWVRLVVTSPNTLKSANASYSICS